MDKSKQKINNWLIKSKRDINLCAHVFYEILNAKEDERWKLLQYFLTVYDEIESVFNESLEPIYISDSKCLDLKAEYQKRSDDFFLELMEKNPTEQEFYCKLWDYISNSSDFPFDEARIFALYNMAVDLRIPYYQLGWDKILHLEENEFHSLNHLFDEMGYDTFLKYVLKYPTENVTEKANLIINLMEKIPEKLKPIMLERIITFVEVCSVLSCTKNQENSSEWVS